MYFIVKLVVTAFVVALISEIGKRSSFIGGVLASLPLASILAFVWMYQETKQTQEIIQLSYLIFWMVIPSLLFFIMLPFFLKSGMKFYSALALSSLLMFAFYSAYTFALGKLGVKL